MPADPRPLVGCRVTLRYRVRDTAHRRLRSDAVGDLDTDGTHWVVHTANGPVTVDPADVLAVRGIPPPTPRRAPLAAVAEVERVCAAAWPAPTVVALGEWLLRGGAQCTARTSSALAVGDPGMPVPDALAEVQRFAAAHGHRPRVQVARSTPWESQVWRAGWVADGEPVSVRTAPVTELAGHVPGAEILDTPTPDWWQRVAGTAEPDDPTRQVLMGGRIGYGVARAGADAVGAVRAALVDGWLHLGRLTVDPAWQRRGVARALTSAAVAWGRRHGAEHAVLQVAAGNTTATRLYDALGAREHHSYRYWVPPAPDSPPNRSDSTPATGPAATV